MKRHEEAGPSLLAMWEAKDRGDDAEAQRLSDEIDRHSLLHTDPPCAACDADVRRSRTLRGRVGSWLIKLGARLGGLHAHDRRTL